MNVAEAAIRAALTACERSLAAHAANVRHLRALVEGDAGAPDLRHDGVDIDAPHRRAATIDMEALPATLPGPPSRDEVFGPVPRVRVRPPPRHSLNGVPMYIEQLAKLAGCSAKAMEQRIRVGKMSPEAAVAAGPSMLRHAQPKPPAPALRKTYEVDGAQMTIAQMAEAANCSWATMWMRVKAGHAPADAIAMGAANARRKAGPPTPKPAPLTGFSIFNPMPVPQHLVNTKPAYPPDPEQRRGA